MGVLDDAIREHLDLKRSRGADPTEIERLAQEALGPVRRDPVRGGLQFGDAPGALEAARPVDDSEVHSEYHDSTAPHWQGDRFEEHLDSVNGPAERHDEAVAPERPKRRGFLRRRGGSSREPEPEPVVEPERFWPEDHDEADHFPEGHFEPGYPEDELSRLHGEPASSVGGGTELPYDDGPMTELHQVVDVEPTVEPDIADLKHPLDGPADDAPPTREELVAQPSTTTPVEPELPVSQPEPEAESVVEAEPDPVVEPESEPQLEAEPELEHPLVTTEPAAAETPAPEPAPPAPERQSPLGPEIEAQPQGTSAIPPPLAFENPPRRPRFTTEPPGLAPSRPASPGEDAAAAREELQRTSEFDVQEHLETEPIDEDVLEETPEFLQDTPEHDRLWFEQRPPRDFDFDG